MGSTCHIYILFSITDINGEPVTLWKWADGTNLDMENDFHVTNTYKAYEQVNGFFSTSSPPANRTN